MRSSYSAMMCHAGREDPEVMKAQGKDERP